MLYDEVLTSNATSNRDYNRSPLNNFEYTREKVSISWENLDVFVKVPQPSLRKRLHLITEEHEKPTRKQILYNLSGRIDAGSLLAVMGASGAGKSTLMNVLAQRNIGQMDVTGTVLLNDCPIRSEMTSMSAYIQQEDLFVGTLTVREHLTFQASLRMDGTVSREQRIARVQEVMLQFGLTKCADTFIGIPGRLQGISGGEKRRLSFASEIITDPPLLFADEPTSGLDSFMAQNLVATMQQLADQGRTIICTIHQPSSEVYAMFHSILMLAEGRIAFMGSTENAIHYFKCLGYTCPDNFNPADFFVRTLAIKPGDEENCRKRVKTICDAYTQESAANETKRAKKVLQDSFSGNDYAVRRSPYKVSWFQQFRSVLWRSWLTNNRDSTVFKMRFLQSIFAGLMTGLFFFKSCGGQDGIYNVFGVMFYLITSTSYIQIYSVVFTFPEERRVFLRDNHSGMYRTDIYFLCKTFAQVPQFVFGPLLMIAIGYWMAGLRADPLRFLFAYGILVLVSMASVSYTYVISAFAPTSSASIAIIEPMVLPFLLLGGFFKDNTTLPWWLKVVQFFSWWNYGFEAMAINQWDNYGNITCSFKGKASHLPCIGNGEEAIESRGLDKDHLLIDICGLLALIIAFRIIAFLILLRSTYRKP
ncbi:unnamed protein product [Porites evermanni]|uniref:ABC transporter domain-containing protein n=1 Tax=Porites evermanni TaxID=104178 RepID=A0ABN8MZ54_9CNID|nr:unnamed protein product [Porites evermanni]